jgi:threonine/homoserine/homoserine lactone efflux protein
VTGSELVSLLLLAFTAAASPFSLIAFSLVLATDRGPKNGIAFICGWIFTVTLIGVVMAILGAGFEFTSTNTLGKWTLALELALGWCCLWWIRRRFRIETGAAEVERRSHRRGNDLVTMGIRVRSSRGAVRRGR